MQLCVMAAMVFYFLLLRSKAKQQDDWAGRGRKLFNAGGRLTRPGLVDRVEDVQHGTVTNVEHCFLVREVDISIKAGGR
jgi:preprotein translocase subunit YajC